MQEAASIGVGSLTRMLRQWSSSRPSSSESAPVGARSAGQQIGLTVHLDAFAKANLETSSAGGEEGDPVGINADNDACMAAGRLELQALAGRDGEPSCINSELGAGPRRTRPFRARRNRSRRMRLRSGSAQELELGNELALS